MLQAKTKSCKLPEDKDFVKNINHSSEVEHSFLVSHGMDVIFKVNCIVTDCGTTLHHNGQINIFDNHFNPIRNLSSW